MSITSWTSCPATPPAPRCPAPRPPPRRYAYEPPPLRHLRDTTALETARQELAAGFGDLVRTTAFDVTDSAEVSAGVARVEDEVGPIDILVNNTGVQHRAPLLDFADEDWHRLLATNLTSAFLVGREVARRMAPRGHGKIVNICSLQSEAVRPGIAPYSATKGGLKMLTKGMCADLGPLGIQVNDIGPGYFDTEPRRSSPTTSSAPGSGVGPAGRWGEVGDLVGALIFLTSPASDFVGGQVLSVDGGMLSVL
ncbi:SDR family oxidoreductase [Streptomyces sp. CA-249302]|uniref:SDR family oxidoreductase n=1 Tax=Streptomyces sp. CA-249302 TaxID=3240058 RepID=UPI003D8A7927